MADLYQQDDLANMMFGGQKTAAPAATPPSAPVAPASTVPNPFAATSSTTPAPGLFNPFADQTPVQQSTGNPLADQLFGPRSPSSTPSGGARPQTEQEDPNAPWYSKAWNWVNHPLFDEQTAKNWFGWDVDKWGGFGRGAFDVASGLTSPLSLALAIGTFGSGSLLESGGAAALRTAGLGAEEISSITKGAQILSDTVKAGKTAEEGLSAVEAAGIGRNTFLNGINKLKDAGLTTESLMSRGVVQRTGSAMLRKAGMSIASSEKVATGIQALMDAGFTAQNAYGAVVASPRVLDALKEGDYETAKRLAVNVLGGGAFAYLGGRSALRDAGSLMDEAAVKTGLRVKPSDENLKLMQEFGHYDRETIAAGRAAELWADDLRKRYKFTPEEGHRVMKWIQAGQDEAEMARRYNLLAEAGGAEDRIGEEPAVLKAVRAVPARQFPSFEQLKSQFGTTSDPKQAGFIAPNGEMVKLQGEHDQMLGYKPTDNAREDFINETGAIRTRYRMSRAGEEIVFSVPDGGVTEAQAAKMRAAAGGLRYGNMVIENAGTKRSVSIEFPTGAKVNDAIQKVAGYDIGKSAVETAKETGGFTYNPRTGERVTEGHAVEIMPERRRVLDHTATPEDIRQFYRDNRDIFEQHPELHIGGFENELNISATGERAGAEYVAQRLDQRSIANLAKIPENGPPPDEAFIDTGGAGRRRRFANYSLEQRLADLKEPKADDVEMLKALRPLPPDLTEAERKQLDVGKRTEKFREVLRKLPAVEDFVNAAKKGSIGRLWYERSVEAFQAMRELAPEYFRPEDADTWAGVVAATSPQQGVPLNLREALTFWKEWHDAGRPTDERAILAAMRKGTISPLTNMGSKLPNVLKALNGEDMLPETKDKFYKVGNFAQNLRNIGLHVTNDSWMGQFANITEKDMPTPSFYHAMALRTRLAAKELGWEPMQAQAAIWNFTKTLAELSGWKAAGGKYYRPAEMLAELTPEKMANYAKDFADIMANDSEVRARLRELGVNLDELDKRLANVTPKPAVDETASAISLRRSARRIGEGQQRLEGFTEYQRAPRTSTSFDFGSNAEPATVAARRDPFYHKSEEVLAAKMPAKASRESVRQLLKNNGIKDDEMKWTGLDDFLSEHKDKPLTKEQVQNFINANRVEIQEKYLGDVPKPPNWDQIVNREAELRDELEEIGRKNNTMALEVLMTDLSAGRTTLDEFLAQKSRAFERLNTLVNNTPGLYSKLRNYEDVTKQIGDFAAKKTEGQAQYSQYTLPGGENYRELLLTLPQIGGLSGTERSELAALEHARDQQVIGRSAKDVELIRQGRAKGLSDDEINDMLVKTDEFPQQARLDELRDKSRRAEDASFKSQHFQGTPNILAHIRMNDRVDASGKKTLFIEEIQSDWHQKGRREGYELSAEDKARQSKLDSTINDLQAEIETKAESLGADEYTSYNTKFSLVKKAADAGDKAAATMVSRMNDAIDEWNELKLKAGKIPAAPFSKDWHELAMKRVLRYAAEHGYEKVAWTTGEQQAARYDLSKHVDRLVYDDQNNLRAYKNGEAVISKVVKPEELADVVGKDVAKKLLDQEPKGQTAGSDSFKMKLPATRELSGVDLKVGGEGMKGFYDQILPAFVNKYGKKWGAKVGETEIATSKGPKGEDAGQWKWEGPLPNHNKLRDIIYDNSQPIQIRKQARDVLENWTRDNDLEQSLNQHASFELARLLGGEMKPVYNSSARVHAVDVTPEMEKSVMEGQPLFHKIPFNELDQHFPKERADAIRQHYKTYGDQVYGRAFVDYEKRQGPTPGYIRVDERGRELFNALLGDNDWDAVTLTPKTFSKMETAFQELHDNFAQISPSASNKIMQAWSMFRQAAKDHPEGGVAIVPETVRSGRFDPTAAPEERFHVLQSELGRGSLFNHANLMEIYNSPEMEPFHAALDFMGYTDHPKVRALEAVAHIAVGDAGMGGTVEQRAALLDKYFTMLAEQHGVENLKGFEPLLAEEAKGIYDGIVSHLNAQERINEKLTAMGSERSEANARQPEAVGRSVGQGQDAGGTPPAADRGTPEGGADQSQLSLFAKRTDTDHFNDALKELFPDKRFGELTPSEQSRVMLRAQEIKGDHFAGLGPEEAVRHLTSGDSNTDPHVDVSKNDRKMDEARIRELVDQKLVQKAYNPKELRALLDSYDHRKLDDRQRAAAKEISNHFGETLEMAQQHGALEHGVENYVTDLWQKDSDNEAANRLRHEARSGAFSINTNMARHRMFQNAFEGELLGRKLAVTDPIALAAHNRNSFSRIIEARKLLDRLQDKGTRASDGRPMVAPATTGHVLEGPDGENPAVLINPNSIRSIRIADKVVEGLQQSGDLDRLIKEGKIAKLGEDKKGQPIYAWDPHDYQTIDHPAMQKWNFGSADTKGNPVVVKSDLRVHPEAAEYLTRRLGKEKSLVRETAIGRGLKAAGREAKGVLLFGSPFHVIQEGLRAVMTGISPFGIEKWDLRTDPVLARGVEKGLTLGKDYSGVHDFEDGRMVGHSKVLAKIPGLAQTQNWLQEFLFEKYIPGLKARAYKDLFVRYKEAYPEWAPSKVAETAAADTNERFGGINYKRMGRSVATQDLFGLVALAPDWLESEMRFMARSFGDEGKIARRDVARMAVGLWAAARVLNYLTTGQPHNEAPFGVAVKDDKGREKVYSVRTLPTDMLHAVSDPGNFLSGRVAPLARAAVQTYTGRDEYGRKLSHFNVATNVLRTTLPIPAQSAIKQVTGESPLLSTPDQIVKAAGGTAMPYRTEASKKAAELASAKSDSGPIDPAQLRHHQALLEFEDQLRSGKMKPQDLYGAVESGQIHVKDAKQMIKNAQETQGMDADLARLYLRASRLGFGDMLEIWDVATTQEKAALTQLLLKKKQQYLKKAFTEMTPQQRLQDPTYQRIRRMFPNTPPW